MDAVLLSVILPCYNSSEFISDAIESILQQKYKYFEFIIIDDGSSDDSPEIINRYALSDNRIILIKNETNLGLIRSLNQGISISKGKYIVRMDADDISLPDRFEKQVDYLEKHPDIGVLGTYIYEFNKPGETRIRKVPLIHDYIKAYLFIASPFFHPTVMIRREIMINHSIYYDEKFYRAEDHALWINLLKYTKGANLPEVLLKYRVLDTSETRLGDKDRKKRREVLSDIHRLALAQIGMSLSNEQQMLYSCSMARMDITLVKNKTSNDLIKLFDNVIKKGKENPQINTNELKRNLSLRFIAFIFYSGAFSKLKQMLRILTSSYFYIGLYMLIKRA